MKNNLVALGHTLLFFGYVGCFTAAVHFLGRVIGTDPMYIFAGVMALVCGIFMFQIQRARLNDQEKLENKTS